MIYILWQMNTLKRIIKGHKKYSNTNHSVQMINLVKLNNILKIKIRETKRKTQTKKKTNRTKLTNLMKKTVTIKKCYKIIIMISQKTRNKRFRNKFRNT